MHKSPSTSRKGSFFGGSSNSSRGTIPTTTRPNTSSGSVSTKSSSFGSIDDYPPGTVVYVPRANPFLGRKPSFSLLSKPPPPPPPPALQRRPSIVTTNLPQQASPERRRTGSEQVVAGRSRSRSRPSTSKGAAERRESIQQASPDIFAQRPPEVVEQTRAANRDRESITSTTPYSNMLTASSFQREVRPPTSYHASSGSFGASQMTTSSAPAVPSSPTLENITYQHIQDMASKRISTLDYLRKAHEGHVYWFNTLLFDKPDLARMPYFDTRKLARRATNYLLLGLSLPTVVDLNGATALDFLRTLNALLGEFETFQQIHPPDGSTSSSLSRARLPQMFKRAGVAGGKGRRQSSAADIGLPMGSDSPDTTTGSGASSSAFPSSENELLPGEEYTHLLTPSLPFDPDFYETFATLCDVLIDCYTKLMILLSSPKECGPHIAELFTKADARVRKIIIQGVVKEFEDTSRNGIRGEVASVGKVVLGGLM